MPSRTTLTGPAAALLPLLGLLACRGAAPVAPSAPAATPGPSALSAADPQPRPLTVWTVSSLEATEEEAPSLRRSLRDAALALGAGAPGLEIVTKPAYGAAGIADFLRSSAQVAPERLPDLCVLPLEALAELGALGLLQPLRDPELVDRTAAAYPFARRLAGPAETPWGLPLAVDVLHAIVRDAPVPPRWDQLTAGPLALPLGGGAWAPELAPLVSVYAAAGGDLAQLADPDPAVARGSLQALADGLAARQLALPPEGRTPRAAWSHFVGAEAPAAVVNSGAIIGRQTAFPGMRWGPVPGPQGPAPALAWGWALAVTTADPERMAWAVELLRQAGAAEHAADLLSAGLLPPQPEAWAERVARGLAEAPSSAYLEFVQTQLSTAQALEAIDRWGPAWAAAGRALAEGAGAGAAMQALAVPPTP